MKLRRTISITAVAGVALMAMKSEAILVVDFGNDSGSAISFAGNGTESSGSSFSLIPTDGGNQFHITGTSGFADNGALLMSGGSGLEGYIGNSPFTYGAVSTTVIGSYTLEEASVTGNLGTLNLGGLTGNVNWMTIQTLNAGGSLDSSLSINVSGLSYTGGNDDLAALASLGNGAGTMTLAFSFASSPYDLLGLTTATTGLPNTTSYSAVLAVPEPTTMVAGALLLLPFGMSTVRALRRNSTV